MPGLLPGYGILSFAVSISNTALKRLVCAFSHGRTTMQNLAEKPELDFIYILTFFINGVGQPNCK